MNRFKLIALMLIVVTSAMLVACANGTPPTPLPGPDGMRGEAGHPYWDINGDGVYDPGQIRIGKSERPCPSTPIAVRFS